VSTPVLELNANMTSVIGGNALGGYVRRRLADDREPSVTKGGVMKSAGSAFWIAAITSLGFVAAACGGNTSAGSVSAAAPAAPKISDAARHEAQQIFATRCFACHGPSGHGDGPGAAGLNPKPRNYHDAAWQSATSDDQIEKAIVFGGAAVGKSPAMVGNPDLGGKPEVVAALRELIRKFGKEK
jgi:mono/diheme cytochrome c family protein